MGVALIEEKRTENRLRRFGQIQRRPLEALVKRVDCLRPRNTLGKVVKRDLMLNNISGDLEIIDAASYVPPPPSEEQKKKIAKMAAIGEQKRLKSKKGAEAQPSDTAISDTYIR
ncbi:hypothetical protein CR513_58256, partial [Mucuna pruriens]